ncbi:MAG: hypothetical protein IJ016_05650 [Elusimicrobiaceae bacterium]|nr:hypothetical protein [Elusimicrobiaceae bacterium]MBR5609818.1 hypothetical protein [Elusimicrobiaceae bacterium]
MEWIQNNGKDLLAVIGAAVALATAVVKLTPTQKDDNALSKIIKVLSALSLCNPDGSFSK